MNTLYLKNIVRSAVGCFIAAVLLVPALTSAITVGPAKLEYTVDPGSVVNGELYLKNEQAEEQTYYPSYEAFTEQNGVKVFIKSDSLLASWIDTEESVTLKPGEDRKFPFTMTIPADAPPGGHFAIIWWSTNPPNTSGDQQVSIQTRAGILVYVNVRGNATESAKISAFNTANNKTLLGSAQQNFTLQITNDGNTYIKPEGTITISSLFGRVRDTLPINQKGLQILPKSYRTFEDSAWQGAGFYFGPYKVSANVLYGEGSAKQATESFWLWIIPWKPLVIGIVIIILLGMFIRFYDHWLIQHALKQINLDKQRKERKIKK
jgi:hypothetical protein